MEDSYLQSHYPSCISTNSNFSPKQIIIINAVDIIWVKDDLFKFRYNALLYKISTILLWLINQFQPITHMITHQTMIHSPDDSSPDYDSPYDDASDYDSPDDNAPYYDSPAYDSPASSVPQRLRRVPGHVRCLQSGDYSRFVFRGQWSTQP